MANSLKAAICGGPEGNGVSAGPVPVLEDVKTALTLLVENALQAIDLLVFSTPSHIRQEEWFQHRTCLRVATDVQRKTLTITDLGAGMTRADLINMLGVGRPMASVHKCNTETDDEDSSSDFTEEEDDDDDDENEKNQHEEKHIEEQQTTAEASSSSLPAPPSTTTTHTTGLFKNKTQATSATSSNFFAMPAVPSCKKSDIGGFYSALCALGTGALVGTKVG